MAIHSVTAQKPASLTPAARIVVRARASSETHQLLLRANSATAGWFEPQRLAAGQWLLDRDVDQADLWISRADGASFPGGSQCELLIVATGVDEDAARIPNVDLVGKQEAMVASFQREPDRILVSIPHVVPSFHTPTAQAAIAFARQILGVDTLGADAKDVCVDIDGSASMRPLAESGVLAEVLEVLFGVTRVIDPDHVMPFDVLVEEGDSVPGAAGQGDASAEGPGARPGELVAAAMLRDRQASTRFSAVRSAGGSAPVTSGTRFIVTDGPPHDLAELERIHTNSMQQHLVLICPREVGQAWTIETALPVTIVPPTEPLSREVVESLLQTHTRSNESPTS